MTQVPLAQFQTQLCLSDQVLCLLLRENRLVVSTDPERGLVVDITSETLRTVVDAIRTRTDELPAPAQELLEERIGTLIADMFGRVTETALRTVLEELQMK